MLVVEKMRIGVDVVDGAAVDADGSEQTSVRGRTRKVGAHVAVLEKNGAASVAAFDAAIEIVPLIGPANWRVRLLDFVEVRERFATRDFAKKGEHAVKHASISGAGHDEILVAFDDSICEPKAVRA